MTTIEAKALRLKQQGLSNKDVEKQLGTEFIFMTDPSTGETVSATEWKD